MRIKIVFIFHVLFAYFSYGQILVVDAISKDPIPFVAVQSISAKKGYYTGKNSRLNLTKFKNDSILITSMGYKSLLLKSNAIKDTIFLSSKYEILDEVTVYSKINTFKEVGYSKKKKFLSWFIDSKTQIGSLVFPNKENRGMIVKEVHIPIYVKSKIKRKRFNSVFKVNVFSNKNNLPHIPLLERPIVVYYDENSDKTVVIDVPNDNIILVDTGIFICIEMIGELDEIGNVVDDREPKLGFRYTNKMSKDIKSTPYAKGILSGKWDKLDISNFKLETVNTSNFKLAVGLSLAKHD